MKHTVILISLALVLIFLGAGCATDPVDSSEPRTISVSGTGSVTEEPDTAKFTVGYSELADTTREAQKGVSARMNEAMDLLGRKGIPEDQVTLLQLSISPEYQWREGERYLAGQRVRQSLSVELSDLGVIADILDGLGDIQGIEISSITFSIRDTSALHIRARELAFEHAFQKAKQLSELGGMTLSNPLSITESSGDVFYEPQMERVMMLADAKESSVIPTGTLEITSRVSVVFEMR